MTVEKACRFGALAKGAWAAVLTAALVLGLGTSGAGAGGTTTKSQARAGLLALSDLPQGWTAGQSTDSGGGVVSKVIPGADQLAGCLGIPATSITADPPTLNSPQFTSPDQSTSVEDSVSIFPSAASARAQQVVIANAKTPGCMASLLNGPDQAQAQSQFGEGAALGTSSVTRAPGSYGKGVTALTLLFPVYDQGQHLVTRATVVFFVKGNLGQELTLSTLASTFPRSLSKRLVSVLARRL